MCLYIHLEESYDTRTFIIINVRLRLNDVHYTYMKIRKLDFIRSLYDYFQVFYALSHAERASCALRQEDFGTLASLRSQL